MIDFKINNERRFNVVNLVTLINSKYYSSELKLLLFKTLPNLISVHPSLLNIREYSDYIKISIFEDEQIHKRIAL
jgi:hypothetical protein